MNGIRYTDPAAKEPDTANRFPLTVGMFMHYCGTLELLVNNAIKAFATDEVLSSAAIKAPLRRKIEILKELLHKRSDLASEDVDALCDELHVTREHRNDVAHNPIVTSKPDEWDDAVVLCVQYKPDGTVKTKKLTRKTIAGFVNQSKDLMLRFIQLVPEATQT